MATTATPPVSAPAAAAPSTPAPASTPSPVTSTPSTPSTPTQPQSMEDKLSAGWQAAKAAVPLEEAPTETPETPAETITPEAETTPEVTETPAPEAETTPAEPETTETPAETPTEELVLDDGTAADPRMLADWLTKNPDVKKAFDADPDFKNYAFAAFRRDAASREIMQYIPDVETAKQVSQAASTFQNIDNHFVKATTPEGAQEFLNHWVREAMIIDDKGQPKIGADGKYELHPALPFIFDHIAKNKLAVLGEQAKTSGNERLQAAVDIINEALSPSSSASGEFPDELKPYADSLKAKEEALNKRESDAARQQREAQQAAHTQSIDRAETKVSDSIRDLLKPSFAKAELTKFEQNAALREIGENVDALLEKNQLYQSIYESILLDPPSEAREARLVKHMLTYTNEIIGPIAANVLRDAKGGTATRQAVKQAKVEEQKKTSATDPRGTSITPAQARPDNSNAAIIKQYMDTHNGEKPSMDYVLGEALKRASGRK